MIFQIVLVKLLKYFRALTRPYKDCLAAPSQLKLSEYFPNWVFPKFLNLIKLKNKYHWFFVHTRSYKLQFDYDHLLITMLHENYSNNLSSITVLACCCLHFWLCAFVVVLRDNSAVFARTSKVEYNDLHLFVLIC